jgi:outer membrane protein OmpA-like peptidoglycan-associated protein
VSQRRAEAVVAYLVAQGVDAQRLSTQPAGESNPLSTEVSPTADDLNRRTDFVIFGLLGE